MTRLPRLRRYEWWALARLILAVVQIFGWIAVALLFLETGGRDWSIGVTIVMAASTITSFCLFGIRKLDSEYH